MSPARLSLVVLSILWLLVIPLACTGKGPGPEKTAAAVAAGAPAQGGAETAVVQAGPHELATVTGPVKMQVLPQFELLDRRGPSLDFHVLIRLRGEGEVTGERPPLDLAVILDRSGSMAGEKLLAVKQATLDLLKELRPIDHLTLVAYDDVIDVLAERLVVDAAGAGVAREATLALYQRGGTALGPAMVRGLEILEPAKRAERELAHVMLLSDGQANVGEKDPEVLGARAGEAFRRGVSVSTLGVGLDYNEDLMTKLADQGGGRYHFIQGTDAIPRVLADEFAGLVATVASGVSLTLQPAPGVEVVRVYGYPMRQEEGTTVIPVGALAAQQQREIVVQLRMNFGTAGDEAALGVFVVDATDQTQQGAKVHGELAAAVRTSGDEAAIRASERTEVTVRVAEVESAAKLEEAARAVDGGDYDQARQVLRSNLAELQAQQAATPSAKLKQQIEAIQEADAGLDLARTSAEQAKIYKKQSKSKAYKLGK